MCEVCSDKMPRVKVTPRTRILSSESDLSDFVDTPSQKYQSKCKARKSSVSETSTSSDAGCNDIAKKKELRIHLKKIDIEEKVEVDKQDKSDQDSDEYILKRKSKRKYKNDHWENTTSSEDESDEESSLFEEELTTTNRKRTKRVQRTGDNSDGSESAESSTEISSRDEEEEDTDNTRRRQTRQAAKRRKRTRKGKQEKKKNSGRKAIRHVLAADELNEETKVAEKEEEERRKRLEERGDNKIVEVDVDEHSSLHSQPITKRLVLQKDPLVEVHPFITVNLKPHQVEGIQFIWDNLVESTKCAEKGDGSGCILAHCMGLGKTLQTISATHTILTSDHLSLLTVLVVAPLNTLLNWIDEYSRWMPDDQALQLYNLAQYQTTRHRIDALKKWRDRGGVMVMGYDMFRLLATGTRIKHKPHKKKLEEFLLDPGPDIIVCDEGHKLKNSEAHISKIMGKIKTKRRLILTGTPLQNNLAEYQCMVNFVKPNLLGTLKEFRNRFVNPIQNGQHSDSTYHDVRIMKKRCHVLHEMLRGFVQRKDYSALAQYLCDKHEYIIKVRQTALQIKLYQHYLDTLTNRGNNPHAVVQGNRDTGLFADYQNLMRIWTHPRVLKMHTDKKAAEMKNFMTSSEEEDEALSTEEEGEGKGNFEENTSEKVGLTTIKEGETHVNGHELKALYSDDDDGDFDITERTQNSQRKRRKRIQDSDDEPSEESSLSTSSSSDEEGDSEERKDDSLKFRRRTRAGRYRLRGGNSDSSDGGETSDIEMNGLDKEEQQKDDEAWYSSLIKEDDFLAQDAGGKITVLFEILRLANECDDKVLVFSQSLLSLDLIEHMLAETTLKTITCGDMPNEADSYGVWYKNIDYFRIDGSSVSKTRQRYINMFNDENDRRARLFLISTRAGSLGVNLVAANRVVIFDASWNPSHDIQSIFRVYRFGQVKACYVYRLIAQGTMEEKIYDRQVTKQSLSFRVVDEQQINRHFTAHDLQELYNFTPLVAQDDEDGTSHALPKDNLLADILVGDKTKKLISSYHQHDSLLDHQETEELSEADRKAAWDEYENEKKGRQAKPIITSINYSDLTAEQQRFYQDKFVQQMKESQITSQTSSFLQSNLSKLTLKKQQEAKSIHAMMVKTQQAINRVATTLHEQQPVPLETDVKNLRKLPMYESMGNPALQLIAFELSTARKNLRNLAEREFKQQQSYLHGLNARLAMVLSESIPNSSALPNATSGSYAFKLPPNQFKPVSMDTLIQQPTTSNNQMLQQAALLARQSFAQMIAPQGNAGTTSINNLPDNDLTSAKNEIAEVVDGDFLMRESSADTKPVPTRENQNFPPPDSANKAGVKNDDDCFIVERKPDAGKASPVIAPHSAPSSVNIQQPVLTVKLGQGTGGERGSRKQKTPKRKNSENKDEEEMEDSEEEDWEAAYIKNAKSRSTRSRNRQGS